MQSQPGQATGSPRAAPKLKNASPSTDHEKPPERGLHEAPAYRRLAAIASAAGYPEVTANRVHGWASAGLVGDVTAPDVHDRLLAICGARRRTASRANVTVLLWANGWSVDDDLLRRSVLTALPGRGLRRDSDKPLDQLDEVAVRKASRLLRILRPGKLPKTMRDFGRSAAGTLAAIGYGVAAPIDDATGTLLERAAGLHRARTDAVDGVPPWLVGRPSRIFRLMTRYARPVTVRRYMREVSSRRLRIARPYARFLIEDFPSVARALECRRGRGFAGFGWIATLGPRNATMLALVAIYTVRFPALRRRFDTFIEGLQPAVAPAVPTCALYAAYIARHPDQRAALRRHGLDGLMARGELRRTDGLGELLDSLLATSNESAT